MLPSTTHRVTEATDAQINERIRQDTEASIAGHAGSRSDIERRLAELDREWDIERTLEANAATVSLEEERHALKALRGDYADVSRVEARSPEESDGARAFQAARR